MIPDGWAGVAFIAAWYGVPLLVGAWLNVKRFWLVFVLTIVFAPAGLAYAIFSKKEEPLPKAEKSATLRTAALCLSMVVAAMMFTPSAQAAEYSYSKTARWTSTGFEIYNLTLSATWDGLTPRQCNSLYNCVANLHWTRNYNRCCGWELDHWLPAINDSGYDAYGNQWKSRKQPAQFKLCATREPLPPICNYNTVWIKVIVWSDGRTNWGQGG